MSTFTSGVNGSSLPMANVGNVSQFSTNIDSSISYFPSPEEKPHFDGLFRRADVENTQRLEGANAVTFLKLSGVDVTVLKEVINRILSELFQNL